MQLLLITPRTCVMLSCPRPRKAGMSCALASHWILMQCHSSDSECARESHLRIRSSFTLTLLHPSIPARFREHSCQPCSTGGEVGGGVLSCAPRFLKGSCLVDLILLARCA